MRQIPVDINVIEQRLLPLESVAQLEIGKKKKIKILKAINRWRRTKTCSIFLFIFVAKNLPTAYQFFTRMMSHLLGNIERCFVLFIP